MVGEPACLFRDERRRTPVHPSGSGGGAGTVIILPYVFPVIYKTWQEASRCNLPEVHRHRRSDRQHVVLLRIEERAAALWNVRLHTESRILGIDLGNDSDGGDRGGTVVPDDCHQLVTCVDGESLRNSPLLRSDTGSFGDSYLALFLCDCASQGVPDELDMVDRAHVEA